PFRSCLLPSPSQSRLLRPDQLEQAWPVLVRDVAHLFLGPRLEWIGQHQHPQPAASAVGGHGVRQMLELSCYDDDRRLPPVRGRDRVVDAPGGTAASVAQPDDRDVYLVGERVELGERLLAFVGSKIVMRPMRASSSFLLSSASVPGIVRPVLAPHTQRRTVAPRGAQYANRAEPERRMRTAPSPSAGCEPPPLGQFGPPGRD